jgi:hypothetical protein
VAPGSEPEGAPSVSETEWGEGTSPEAEPPATRVLKRMTVAQVRDSMEQITGGIPWGSDARSHWDEYSATLGVADYQLIVKSDSSPTVMFQKFLDDAAGATCQAWVAAESGSFFAIESPGSTEREDIRAQVANLRWRIQGRDRASTDAVLDDYEAVFTKVHQRTASTEAAWATVCVALFTHPDFFMY